MHGESAEEVEFRLFKEGHKKEMDALNTTFTAFEARFRTIERLAWVATGGVLVIGAIVAIIGGNILRLLAH